MGARAFADMDTGFFFNRLACGVVPPCSRYVWYVPCQAFSWLPCCAVEVPSYICVSVYLSVYLHVPIYLYVYLHVCNFTCMCKYTYVCVHTHKHVNICVCICMYMCVCACACSFLQAGRIPHCTPKLHLVLRREHLVAALPIQVGVIFISSSRCNTYRPLPLSSFRVTFLPFAVHCLPSSDIVSIHRTHP